MADNDNIDVDLNFAIHPVRKDISKRVDSDAIKQSMRNIILTRYFERPFNPEFGCGIYDFLFENITPITILNMENAVRQALLNWEPRVEIIDVNIDAKPDQNEVEIQILYAELDREQPDELTVILQRTR